MKLYTEEQVMQAYNAGIDDGNWDRYKEDIVALKLTPIELPSDEEIENVAKISCYENDVHLFSWGAKWMKEQILNQNKELLILDFDKVKEEWIKEANGMTELEKVKYYFKKINDNQNK